MSSSMTSGIPRRGQHPRMCLQAAVPDHVQPTEIRNNRNKKCKACSILLKSLKLERVLNLDSISSCVPSSLPAHELKAVSESTEKTCQKSPMPAVPVPGICSDSRCWHTGHWVMRDALPEGVPLVVGSQVDRGREEGEAGSAAPATKTRVRPSSLWEPNT